MLERGRFALNRILAPSLGLGEFYDLAAALGLKKVELRNDLGGRDPVDGLAPAEAVRLARERGLEVISINALQRFNLASARAEAGAELDRLLDLARAIGCRAVVLCPNNDPGDGRDPGRRFAETIAALASYGPRFEAAGVLGYVEPLGFAASSLASQAVAREAIARSGFSCYRLVHDTFHHHIGPEAPGVLGGAWDVAMTGLVHVSGVEAPIARHAWRDEHRVLPGPGDALETKEQVRRLDELGYRGDFSFEPFSPAIQRLGKAELAAAIERSLGHLLGDLTRRRGSGS